MVEHLDLEDCHKIALRFDNVDQVFDLLYKLERSTPGSMDYPHGTDISIGTQSMSVGLAPDYWVLLYADIQNGRLLDSKAAVGDENAKGHTYYFFTTDLDIPNRNLIPRQQAISILRKWLETQELSQECEWDDTM